MKGFFLSISLKNILVTRLNKHSFEARKKKNINSSDTKKSNKFKHGNVDGLSNEYFIFERKSIDLKYVISTFNESRTTGRTLLSISTSIRSKFVAWIFQWLFIYFLRNVHPI